MPEKIQEVKDIFKTYLEQHKLRKTPERFAILEEIYSREEHFDAEALFQLLKQKEFSISRATVYNTLDLLLSCELVSKHQFGENHTQYEKSYGSRQHDHLICIECNKVIEFCDPRILQIQEKIGQLMNFDIKHHSLMLYGSCNNCQNKKNSTTEK